MKREIKHEIEEMLNQVQHDISLFFASLKYYQIWVIRILDLFRISIFGFRIYDVMRVNRSSAHL
jgi:hypothetical protein